MRTISVSPNFKAPIKAKITKISLNILIYNVIDNLDTYLYKQVKHIQLIKMLIISLRNSYKKA